MQDVVNFLNRILPFLQALVAGGVIKSNSGVVIAQLLGDVENVIKGVHAPTADLVASVEQLLNDLKVDNVLKGQFIDALDAGMIQFGSFTKAIVANQPGIGPKESLFGVKGSWVFIPDGAAADVKAPFGL